MHGSTQIATFVAAISVALAANVLFRRERERAHRSFAAFAVAVATREALSAYFDVSPSADSGRFVGAATVVVAYTAMRFFREFVRSEGSGDLWLARVSPWLAVPVFALLASPLGVEAIGDASVVAFVLLSFTTAVSSLERARRHTRSRREAERIRFLTTIGAVAGVLTLADYVPMAEDLGLGAIAPIFLLGFLYMLAQAVLRDRVLDLYDLAGRAAVLATLAMILAAVMVGMMRFSGRTSFAPAFVAALAVLLVLEPLRGAVEAWLHRLFFVDRRELERRLGEARSRIAASIDPTSAARIGLDALESSGRVTHASVYFVEPDRRALVLAHAVFGNPPARVDAIALAPVLSRLQHADTVVVESLERDLERLRRRGEDREAEAVFEAKARLEALDASIAVAVRTAGGELVGVLTARDERARDAFAIDELPLLVGLGVSLGEAFSRSVEHRASKDRERLVALGEMAAGLAHEIRNPLGAIKGTAQLLGDGGPGDRELLSIMVEEVDRLNRVVAGFLDYARPTTTVEATCNPASTVERTVQLLQAEPLAQGPRLGVSIDPAVPDVTMDAEKLRQVVWNLSRNALEALGGSGELLIEVQAVEAGPTEREPTWVEVTVADDGPGIDAGVLGNLFVPFVTTKPRGTGLGLATSQRLVSEAGGRIDVKTSKGRGTRFTVRLPAVRSRARSPESDRA